MNLRTIVVCVFITALSLHAVAQEEHAGHAQHQQNGTSAGHSFASGTSWLPASSPVFMWMAGWRDWTFMSHANVFLAYNQQGGPRGVGKLESANWIMLMEERKLAGGSLQFRQMLSAEPATTPRPGFPQLFQTGEVYQRRPLIDHQHPHDLFSEISVLYTRPLGERLKWLLYGGPAGEPALGPVAFPHRISASENPAAPLSHHVQDSTHISYGVLTTGFIFAGVKLEASAFNGREPDEERWNFDLGPLDSWSARLGFSPNPNWTMQYSFAHLKHPEALEPGNIDRQTASIMYNRPLTRGYWASTLIWGRNHKSEEGTVQNSYVLESALNFAQKNYAYSRLELVDKDELFPGEHDSFRIGDFTFGAVRDIAQTRNARVGIGADVTFYSKPDALDRFYGNNPVSFRVFVRFRPGIMHH